MGFIISILGLIGMVGVWFLAKSLTILGLAIAVLLFVILYLLTWRYGDDIAPRMKLVPPTAVLFTGIGLLGGTIYYKWEEHLREPISRSVNLLTSLIVN